VKSKLIQRFCERFHKLCLNFHGFCPNFQQIKSFRGAVARPLPAPMAGKEKFHKIKTISAFGKTDELPSFGVYGLDYITQS